MHPVVTVAPGSGDNPPCLKIITNIQIEQKQHSCRTFTTGTELNAICMGRNGNIQSLVAAGFLLLLFASLVLNNILGEAPFYCTKIFKLQVFVKHPILNIPSTIYPKKPLRWPFPALKKEGLVPKEIQGKASTL